MSSGDGMLASGDWLQGQPLLRPLLRDTLSLRCSHAGICTMAGTATSLQLPLVLLVYLRQKLGPSVVKLPLSALQLLTRAGHRW